MIPMLFSSFSGNHSKRKSILYSGRYLNQSSMKLIESWRYPVIIIGIAAYCLDQYMNIEYMWSLEQQITSNMIAIPIAGAACVYTFPTIGHAVRTRQYFSAFLLCIMFIILSIFSLGASLDRVGGSVDKYLHRVKSTNVPVKLAMADLKAASQALLKAETEMARQEVTGFGPLWKEANNLLVAAKARKKNAQIRLASLGSFHQESSSMAIRLSRLLQVETEQVETYHPMTLPLGIWLASILFIGVGFSGPSHSSISRNEPPENLAKNDNFSDQKKLQTPLSTADRIILFMEEQHALLGRYPTYTKAAEQLKVSRTTICRYFKPHKTLLAAQC